MNQVVLWDKIIQRGDSAKLDYCSMNVQTPNTQPPPCGRSVNPLPSNKFNTFVFFQLVNQVVLWYKIIQRGDNAKLDYRSMNVQISDPQHQVPTRPMVTPFLVIKRLFTMGRQSTQFCKHKQSNTILRACLPEGGPIIHFRRFYTVKNNHQCLPNP